MHASIGGGDAGEGGRRGRLSRELRFRCVQTRGIYDYKFRREGRRPPRRRESRTHDWVRGPSAGWNASAFA